MAAETTRYAIGYTPESVAHPGDVLNDFLEDREIQVEDLAQDLGEDVDALKKIIKEEDLIGKRLARKLAKFFEYLKAILLIIKPTTPPM